MFNFRRVASVLASATMITSTVALAAAANYPAPFIQGGTADVGVVYGGNAASTDFVAVVDITNNLQASLASQTASGSTTTGGSISGEAAPLFSGATKLYINDTLNAVFTVVTESELPTVLADETFSGNVDATLTQTLDVGSNPRLTFAKQPTSSDDPELAWTLGTSTTTQYLYNATVSFNKAVNLSHASSEGQTIKMFGQTFTISSSTDATDLILLKSAEKVSLDSDNPTAEVTVGGNTYTLELVSASDTAATIRVTDSSGKSDSKEVSEAQSKKINGITIAVDTADETNLKLSATVIAGAEKVTMTSGSSITIGENADVIDGTSVLFTGGVGAMTKLVVTVAAPNSDVDAIRTGEEFLDPVFGSFKLNFAGFNIPEDSSSREAISVSNSGDDKMQLTLTDRRGNTKTVQWAINLSEKIELQHDSDYRNITVFEAGQTYRNEWIVVGNEDTGRLLRVSTITNQTTGYSSDKVRFTDIFSGDTYEATLTADGTGTVTIGGKVYTLNYYGDASSAEDSRYIKLNYPDSVAAANAVIFPTIQTNKGALLAFYEPTKVNLTAWDGLLTGTATTVLEFPDGDGYTTATFTPGAQTGNFTLTGAGSGTLNTSQAAKFGGVALTIGRLTYNATTTGTTNQTEIVLLQPDGTPVYDPALIIFEEQDDNNNYEALIVTLEPGKTSDDGLGVDDVVRTWGADTVWDAVSLASDSKKSKEMDLWGTLISVDSSDSDQKSAVISYPNEQVYSEIYFAGADASITAGTSSSSTVKQLGSVTVSDSEVSSVSGKNIVVVGGSCVNSVAANLLGGALCGANFESSTGVGAGSFLIQTFDRGNSKVATLVAGYNAADTTNAAKALTTQTIDTSVGKKYKGSSATSVTLVTTTA